MFKHYNKQIATTYVLYLHVLLLRKSLCPSSSLDKLHFVMLKVIVYHALDANLIVHI
jgi:hypothetical protein